MKLLTALVLILAWTLYLGAQVMVDAAYQRGLEHGRQLERSRPQKCPASVDAMHFWFQGDTTRVGRALNQACKRMKQ